MKRNGSVRPLVASCPILLILAGFFSGSGCGSRPNPLDTRVDSTESSTRVQSTVHEQHPVMVLGCLERSQDGGFVLTQTNEPRLSVGTSGSSSIDVSSALERDRIVTPRQAYLLRIENTDQLERMVGGEVRIMGIVGDDGRRDADVAALRVTSAIAVSDVCTSQRRTSTSQTSP